MRIASVTITRNDWHALEQWQRFYQEYRLALSLHVIVDNASTPEYKQKLRELFPDSILLERTENGGTTAAYNDGIKRILEYPEINAIMLIANDIRLNCEDVTKLYTALWQENSLGAIAPILLDKDERTIIAFGEKLYPDMGLDHLYSKQILTVDLPEYIDAECLPGGMCMVKCEVYQKVGLQDESLFMYMDENDFFKRVCVAGYRLKAIRSAVAAHCHISIERGRGNDSGLALFYIYRNHLLVCRKYVSNFAALKLFLRYFLLTHPKYLIVFTVDRTYSKIYYAYLGLFAGFFGIRSNFVKK